MLERIFKLSANKTNVRTEIIAGITTFMTMAYILAVNPGILSEAGMDKGAVFTATVISSALATLVMAFYARLPFALAPGMGLNAFFAYTVCIGMGHTWQFALTAVFLEGLLFIALSFFNVREMIVKSIPVNIKHAISVGIGLFIAFIGLKNAGVIVSDPATFLKLTDITDISTNASPLIALVGLVITGALLGLRVHGALLVGIIISTLLAIPFGITLLPTSFDFMPPSIAPVFAKFEWSQMFTLDMLVITVTFLFVDIFDTVGALIGVSSKADMLDEQGNVPRAKEALMADAIGTTAGAILGTSTVTTYVESAAGVAAGGRTGLTSAVTGVMFILALFLAPLFLMIPAAATAPALILVGAMMISPIKKIDFDDFTESIPVFLTIIMMPLCYSIAEGIVFGMLSYVLLKYLTGQHKQVSWVMSVLAVLFIIKFFI